jgi:hypothetical protein
VRGHAPPDRNAPAAIRPESGGGLGAFIGLGLGTEVVAIVSLFLMFRLRGWIGPARHKSRGPALVR